MGTDRLFGGSIPALYDQYLGPMIFSPLGEFGATVEHAILGPHRSDVISSTGIRAGRMAGDEVVDLEAVLDQAKPLLSTAICYLLIAERNRPCRRPLLLRPVEQHPDGKVRRNILETVRHMCGAKQQIPWAYCSHFVLDPVPTGASGNEIQFVALVRNLRAVRRSCGESYFQFAVNEHLGRDRPGVRGKARAAASDTGGGVRSMILPPARRSNRA